MRDHPNSASENFSEKLEIIYKLGSRKNDFRKNDFEKKLQIYVWGWRPTKLISSNIISAKINSLNDTHREKLVLY